MPPHAANADAQYCVRIRELGLVDYGATWQAMRAFTERRDCATCDEIWLLQHEPVYTQGLNCRAGTRGATRIPIVATDRGGQITYHGPGQVVAYVLVDLRRRGRGAKWLVELLEQSVIDLLDSFGVHGERRSGAPGVYVNDKKVAALGLRIRRGSSYHGVSLNVDMDLSPFANIDPCGYQGLEVTQLTDLGIDLSVDEAQSRLRDHLASLLRPHR